VLAIVCVGDILLGFMKQKLRCLNPQFKSVDIMFIRNKCRKKIKIMNENKTVKTKECAMQRIG